MKKKISCMLLALISMISFTIPAFATNVPAPTASDHYSKAGYFGNWTDGFAAHLIKLDDGYLRLENMQDADILLEYYNEDFQITRASSVPVELEQYIAFFEGEDYYYILFAQDNWEQDDNKEVIRVVKYNKNWKRLDACSISKIGTVSYNQIPHADMAEVDGKLLIHTNHTMYTSRDGLNHEANMRFTLDIATMDVLQKDYAVRSVEYGYVSHSFNQIVEVADDGDVYTADHGDAYPRAMVLFSWPESSIVGRKATDEEYFDTGNYIILPKYVMPLKFYGQVGDNVTGAQLGGMEASSSHVLMAGSSKPQDGTTQRVSNVFITSTPRNNFTDEVTKFTWITNYGDNDNIFNCSCPYLIEIAPDQFFMIWLELRTGPGFCDYTLCWTRIDKEGNQVGEIHSHLGNISAVVPILDGKGNLVWYNSDHTIPDFCILNLATNELKTVEASTYNGPTKDYPSDWAEDEIYEARLAHLITDHTDNCFHSSITRFQFAELVVNMVEESLGDFLPIEESPFSDTRDLNVIKASATGIVKGNGDGTFRPDDPITREQIATMLSRAISYIEQNGGKNLAPLTGNLSGYTDANKVSDWATDAVAQLAANGIMKGTSSTTLSPLDNADVESCILLVYRLYSKM